MGNEVSTVMRALFMLKAAEGGEAHSFDSPAPRQGLGSDTICASVNTKREPESSRDILINEHRFQTENPAPDHTTACSRFDMIR